VKLVQGTADIRVLILIKELFLQFYPRLKIYTFDIQVRSIVNVIVACRPVAM
jgi:hypothetical protein